MTCGDLTKIAAQVYQGASGAAPDEKEGLLPLTEAPMMVESEQAGSDHA
ncbi:MAG: hypothetical protein ABSA53_33870 [Streptosporangiaceae bacterium]